MTHDYYEILHVHPQADREIIKASYRTLMQKLKYHPDLGGDEAEAALINKAYTVLYNTAERARYDRSYNQPHAPKQHVAKTQPSAGSTAAPQTTITCAFCQHSQAPKSKNAYTHNELCTLCGSPITVNEKLSASAQKRDSMRVNRYSEMSLVLSRQPHKKHSVSMENISAFGLSILSALPLTPGDKVKLSNSDLTTVAEVVHCKKAALQYRCGLKFLTVKRKQSVGNFISASA